MAFQLSFSLPSQHSFQLLLWHFLDDRMLNISFSIYQFQFYLNMQIQRENQPKRPASAKFSNSQTKASTQNTRSVAEMKSGTSLFEILRRSSLQSEQCTRDSMVVQTESVFAAFKLSKKPIKTEGKAWRVYIRMPCYCLTQCFLKSSFVYHMFFTSIWAHFRSPGYLIFSSEFGSNQIAFNGNLDGDLLWACESNVVPVYIGCMLAMHSLFLVQINYWECYFLVMNLCLESGST